MAKTSFRGHELVKIGKEWAFNLTEFKGYKLNAQDGVELKESEAFKITREYNNGKYKYYFDKLTAVPLGVLRKAVRIIEMADKEVAG